MARFGWLKQRRIVERPHDKPCQSAWAAIMRVVRRAAAKLGRRHRRSSRRRRR